jgi:hypothetical protein
METCLRCLIHPTLKFERIPDRVFCSEECAQNLWIRSRPLKRGREESSEVITGDNRLLLAVPKDVLVMILEKLSLKALLSAAGTNQYLRGVIREKNVWERVIGQPIPEYARGNELAFGYSVWLSRFLSSGVAFTIENEFRNVHIEVVIVQELLRVEFTRNNESRSCERFYKSSRPESVVSVLYNFWKNWFRWTITE